MPALLSSDLVTGLVSFLLTLMILSYLIGDNPAFRVAIYILVGVSTGYAAAITWWQLLYPRLVLPLLTGNLAGRLLSLIVLILGVLLLMKLSRRTSALGDPVVAFLVGVGAAVAVGGALLGTILPQTQASINLLNLSGAGENWPERLFIGTIMLIGTSTTLAYFHFGTRPTPLGQPRSKLVSIMGWVGQIFIAITLGALFAGAFSAALVALIERANFIWTFLAKLL
jgi:hypothetical protein